MAKAMKPLGAILLGAACLFACLYQAFPWSPLLTAAITCGVAGCHLEIRLLVGMLFTWAPPAHDYTKKRYRLLPWEKRLYQKIHIKAWKNRLPTYVPESFSPKLHSWAEIAQAACRSELVHLTNCLLSFLPVIAALWFHSLPVFLITSILAGAFDLVFIMIQRYNRDRIVKIIMKKTSKGG